MRKKKPLQWDILITIIIANIGWVLSEISLSEIYIHYLNNHCSNPKKLVLSSSSFLRWKNWGLERLSRRVAQIGGSTNKTMAQEGHCCVRGAPPSMSTGSWGLRLQETFKIQRQSCPRLSCHRQGNWGQEQKTGWLYGASVVMYSISQEDT